MVIKKSQTKPFPLDNQSQGLDYPMPDENLGVSYQELNGRQPETGSFRNTVCRELFYIIEGTAEVTIDGKTETVAAGDLIIIEPGQKHAGVYTKVKLITITTPNWYEKQGEMIPET